MNHIPKVHDLERAHGVTWGELAGLEPRLNELLWEARAGGARCRSREDVERVFGPFRNALGELVGFLAGQSRHPILGSVGAYEVAYWRLYDAVAGLLPKPAGDVPRFCPGRRAAARRRFDVPALETSRKT
jgi:hypothetical protein